jgi:hypothetical protein
LNTNLVLQLNSSVRSEKLSAWDLIFCDDDSGCSSSTVSDEQFDFVLQSHCFLFFVFYNTNVDEQFEHSLDSEQLLTMKSILPPQGHFFGNNALDICLRLTHEFCKPSFPSISSDQISSEIIFLSNQISGFSATTSFVSIKEQFFAMAWHEIMKGLRRHLNLRKFITAAIQNIIFKLSLITMINFKEIDGCENSPATKALEQYDNALQTTEYVKSSAKASADSKHNSKRKRRKCEVDLDDLLDGMKTIEDSIAFPTIEWPFEMENTVEWKDTSKSCGNLDEYDENNFSLSLNRPYSSTSSFGRKRSRQGGMVRSNFKTFSLSSLVSTQSEHNISNTLPTSVMSLFSLSKGAAGDENLATMAVNEALSILV